MGEKGQTTPTGGASAPISSGSHLAGATAAAMSSSVSKEMGSPTESGGGSSLAASSLKATDSKVIGIPVETHGAGTAIPGGSSLPAGGSGEKGQAGAGSQSTAGGISYRSGGEVQPRSIPGSDALNLAHDPSETSLG